MKRNAFTSFILSALCAAALPVAALAVGDTGDIVSIQAVPVGEYGSSGNVSAPKNVGEHIYVRVRLLNENWFDALRGIDHPWTMERNGEELPADWKDVVYWPALRIAIGAKKVNAQFSPTGPDGEMSGLNPENSFYTDLYFTYTVKEGELGLPIRLVNAKDQIIDDPTGRNAGSFYFVNVNTQGRTGGYWDLANDLEAGHLANFKYSGPLSGLDPSPLDDRTSYPSDDVKERQQADIIYPGIYVKTIGFESTFQEGDVWRFVYTGLDDNYGKAPAVSGVGPTTVYVWSDDESVVVPVGEVDPTVTDRTVIKVTLGASGEDVPFKLKGGDTAAVGAKAHICLCSQNTPAKNATGDILSGSFVSNTVQIVAAPEPYMAITDADGNESFEVKATVASSSADGGKRMRLTFSTKFDTPVTVKLNPETVLNPGLDAFAKKYVVLLANEGDPTAAPASIDEITMPKNQKEIYFTLYALGSCAELSAGGIRFTPSVKEGQPEAIEDFSRGMHRSALAKITDQKPEIEGRVTAPASAYQGAEFDVDVAVEDNWRDLTTLNTNGYKVTVLLDNAELFSTNGCAFAEDDVQSFTVRIPDDAVPGEDHKLFVKVWDGTNTKKNDCAIYERDFTVVKKLDYDAAPQFFVSGDTDADPDTRTVFCEGDAPYLRFTLTQSSPEALYAMLLPKDEMSSNLVETAALEKKFAINGVLSEGVSLKLVDGDALSVPKTIGSYSLRLFKAADDTPVTTYNTDHWLTLTVTNAAPTVVSVRKGADYNDPEGKLELVDGEWTYKSRVPSGVPVAFSLRIDDLGFIDVTSATTRVRLEWTDGPEGDKWNDSQIVKADTNGIASAAITFSEPEVDQLVSIYLQDRDQKTVSSNPNDFGDVPAFTFRLKVSKMPNAYISFIGGNENGDFYEQTEYSKSRSNPAFNVKLSEFPNGSNTYTDPVTGKKDTPISNNNKLIVRLTLGEFDDTGRLVLTTNHYYFGNVTDINKGMPVYFDRIEQNGGALPSMTIVHTEVMNGNVAEGYPESRNKEGIPWCDYFAASDTPIYIWNQNPSTFSVGKGAGTSFNFKPTGTNTWTAGELITLKWTAGDIVRDVTNGMFTITAEAESGDTLHFFTVTNGHPITVKQTPLNATTTGEFSFLVPSESTAVTVRADDGEGGFAEQTFWIRIVPTKKIAINPFGPAKTTQTKYRTAPGLGRGHVYVDESGSYIVRQFEQTWSFNESKKQAVLFGAGYPASEKPAYDNGEMGKPNYTGAAISATGDKWTSGAYYNYGESEYDNFFYIWAQIGGEDGASGVTYFNAQPTSQPGEVAKHTFTLDNEKEKDSETSYGTVEAEAIFAKELYPSDNMGDINADGIPDLYMLFSWQNGMLGGVFGDDGSITGNDLAKTSGLNPDEDVIPAMDTSKYGTIMPDLAETWVTFGTPFDALTEIRGYHWGLNDAPQQTGVPNAKPNRVYGVTNEVDEIVWDEEKCTISYLEHLAWKDSGLPVDKWSPERPTDPTIADTDDDGMPDGYEYFFWYRAHVGYIDTDGTHRYLVGRRWNPTDPQHPDLILPSEIEQIMDPLDPGDKATINYRDTDNDGIPDLIEFELGTNPFDYDTDGDGLPDGYEVYVSETDPLDPTFGDALLNPDGDQMAFVLQEKWHLVGILNKKGGVDYYVAPELSADGGPAGFSTVDSGVTNSYTLVSAIGEGGETVKYVTTAPAQVYTNADGVACLVGGLPAGRTWLLSKVGGKDVRGRATSLVKGAALAADPEDIELNVLTVTNTPAIYYKAWFYEQEKIKGKLVDVFIRGAECGAKADLDPLAAEGLEVVDIRDDAYVALIHFYAYQETGFDPRVAWKDPGAAISEEGTTRRYTHRDELYLLTFLYHANLMTDGELTPTIQRPWTWIWEMYATNPLSCDTDSDGAPDGWELYVFGGPKTYDEKSGKLVIGYDWTYPRLMPGCAFSPIFPYNGEPNGENFKSDGDGLSEIQEFSAVESVAEYEGKPGAEAITLDDPEWTNKKWPTDPWNADTDNDGLSDSEEQKAFTHNGGLNPLSWDTDMDGLPDPWELEFAGTATLGGGGTNDVAAAGGSTNATANATNATAAGWTWNADGMDGTVNDAMKDYDHDGLRNWQEYMVGAMRCWRYDDITSPWTVNVGDIPEDGEGWYNVLINPESPNFNPGLSDFILDPGLYFSCATNAYEQGGVFGKFYMLKDGYYHDLKIEAQTRADKMNRWVRNLSDPILALEMEGAYPTAYICCDPRLYDTDDDGMDDFYELFHGLNPLLGPVVDIVAQAWGYPEAPLCAVFNNWYEAMPMVPTRPDKEWLAKGPNDRDFFQLPWLAGLPDADPDGDNIRNQQEALFSNVQAASTYLHIDPTPLWMTDGQYEDSLTYRYYHISTPIWGIVPKIWMPGKPYFEYNGKRYYWNDFPWIEYDEKTGICTMDYSINNWKVMDYMFSFEENEGYDSDHDYLGDFEEGQGKTKSASDPQVSDSPLRRQAMWFGGEADKGFLETALEVAELPPEDAGAEEGQKFLYYTVECWAKPDESTYAKAGLQTLVERAIVSGPGNAGDETWLRKNFVLGIRDGRWYTRFDSTGTDANQPVEIAGGPEATTNWTHVAATYDGTALRLYVNGVCTPATTEYTSIQPEHGVNAITVNDLSEYGGKVTVDFAGDRGLGVPQIAMLVGASAISELGVTFDYQWQTRSIMLFGAPRGINTMEQTTMVDYGNFFRGYIDEVRVWDGARKGADILADYEQRVRYDSAMALENREKVFKSWAKGGSRLDHAVEQLPPQLMYHWSFDHVAGAVDRADVMRVPAGFDTSWNVVDSMAIWSRPVDWTSFWLDEGVNGSLWNGQVFSDHAWQPWVTDTISHLPRFDGTVLDSVYWSEDFTGARPVGGLGYTKLQFPRKAEVPSRWTQMLYAAAGEAWAEDVRWEIIQETGDEELMQKYMFARRYLPTVGGDLMIFGSAYAKRISAAEGGMWDDQGPADAWAQTGSDADHNGLPDWWEEYARENYGVDPFAPIDWTTTVNYEGRPMPAWEAYLRDLSRGLTVVNGAPKVRGEYADIRDIDMDGMPDWWEDLYHVDSQSTADTIADSDGDGLSNFAEYIISEKFGFARLNPRDPKTDGVCVDYFLRKGDLYLGEIFTDHDQVNDVWENKYAGFADFYAYDPSRDDDGDGWSNWAEQKAGTDPRLVKETGIDDYTLAGFPVPCIRARIVNNGLTVETAPVVIKAWSERRDPGMTGDPDATWTIAGSANDDQQQAPGANDGGATGAAEMGESSKYLGIKPEGARTLTLGPGAIERNSVKIFYKDLSFCKAQIVGDMIIPTEIGSELEAEWYYLVHDREGKLYTTGGIFADEQEVGTVDYDTGAVTIDFGNDALCGIMLGDPGTTDADGNPTYDLLNLDQSYVLVTWNSSARSGSLNRTLYLSDADDPGDISGRFDHVREGLNSFIAFVDRDGDGAYTAGEPYGFVRGVDVGWSGAEFEIELTETSSVFARVNVFGGGNGGNGGGNGGGAVSDRLTLWGTSCGDTAGASLPTASNDTWAASANAYEHVRIVPYMVAGVYGDGEGSNSFVYAMNYVENRVVAEFDVRKDTKPYITEADFIRDGAFDIDWDGFYTSAFANNSRLTSAVGEVTAVKYRIVFGNEGPVGAEGNLDTSSQGVRSFPILIERRFERTANRTKPTNLSVDGVVCGAQPLFGWRLDEPTDVQVYVNPNTGVTSYVEPAARYGCSYTAFEIQVADRDGNVIYDSGVVRAPVRDADGFFRWTPTDLYAGDQTALGKIFSAAGNWQWRVAMYNAKFKPNVREAMNGWSAWQEFSTSVGTGNTLGDFAHETIDVSVKYTGPVKVLDGCEDLSTTEGTVRVQAFVSPDFSGEPVAQGLISDRAALTDVADAAANGRLIGLLPGDYCLRAYVDTNGNLRKDDWESWGAAAEPVKVGPGIKVPVISFFIEDADTDQDWIPDAWEMQVNKRLDVDNVTVLPDGQIKFKLIYPETTKTGVMGAAAPVTFFQNLSAARFLLTSEADGGGDAVTEILAATQPKAVPGTVAITELALDAGNGEAVLTVTGETEKSEAAEFLDAIYVFPDQPLALNVYRKNALVEKDWTLVKENIPVIIGSGTEAEVRVSLGDDLDMTQGFYMVEIKQ